MILPCVSLRQPWASLVAWNLKTIETRHWFPPYKYIEQRIAIHAAKMPLKKALADVPDDVRHEMRAALNTAAGRHTDWCMDLDMLGHVRLAPLGAVVCTARLANVFKSDHPPVTFREWPPDNFGDYSPGRWMWVLRDVRRLAQPFEVPGRQGFFNVDLPDDLRTAEGEPLW